jgi:nucleoside-diphosphate-sugar epimerase
LTSKGSALPSSGYAPLQEAPSILLTGATGQIGRWLLCRLLELAPHASVTLALRDPGAQLQTLRSWLSARGRPTEQLAMLQARPYRLEDPLGAQALVRTLRPDTIIHLAARFEWGLDRAEAHIAQVQATETLWLAQTDPQGHRGRFIGLGGYLTQLPAHLEQLGIKVPAKEPAESVDWSRVYRRVGGYEASKLETQIHMRSLAATLKRPWLCVHPATVCGHAIEGELPAHAALHALCRQLLQRRLQALPGTPRHQLPLVSADRLADFLAHLALDATIQSGDFLLADHDSPNFHELVRRLALHLGVPAPTRALPLPLMRALLRLPGMARWAGASAEGLDFLVESPHLDTSMADALSQRWALRSPPLDQALAATAQFVRREVLG